MKYDLIIIGGGTSGCACAYTAGLEGLKVLLVEKNSYLGGAMSSALVTPAMKSQTDDAINNNFYKKLMGNLNKIGGQITYSDNNIGWFNPELLKIVLDEMMIEANVDVILDAYSEEVIKDTKKIKGITLNCKYDGLNKSNDSIYSNNIVSEDKMLSEYIETNYVIDATGDAKFFEKNNLKFQNNFEKNNLFQPTTLRFIMSGIDIKKFAEWITHFDLDNNVTTACMVNGEYHLSTAYTWDTDKNWALRPIINSGIKEGIITEEDSNYIQLFTIPGMPASIAFNCPRILEEFDPSDKVLYTKALMKGRQAIFRLSNFFKLKFKGFENAYISSIANTLGVRVSNRILGKYLYTIDDLKSGKNFDNPVLKSKYPIDIHSKNKNNSVLEPTDREYSLPVEALMSKDYDNLFAIGRCISADFYSQAALRIIPSCFSMGEGLAKYIISLN